MLRPRNCLPKRREYRWRVWHVIWGITRVSRGYGRMSTAWPGTPPKYGSRPIRSMRIQCGQPCPTHGLHGQKCCPSRTSQPRRQSNDPDQKTGPTQAERSGPCRLLGALVRGRQTGERGIDCRTQSSPFAPPPTGSVRRSGDCPPGACRAGGSAGTGVERAACGRAQFSAGRPGGDAEANQKASCGCATCGRF